MVTPSLPCWEAGNPGLLPAAPAPAPGGKEGRPEDAAADAPAPDFLPEIAGPLLSNMRCLDDFSRDPPWI